MAEIKSTQTAGPVLLHIITEKGRGYLPAESASDKMHGVGQYDPVTGKQAKGKPKVSQPQMHITSQHPAASMLLMGLRRILKV